MFPIETGITQDSTRGCLNKGRKLNVLGRVRGKDGRVNWSGRERSFHKRLEGPFDIASRWQQIGKP